MSGPTLLRYTAFSERPEGGNPAGVWIGDALPPAAEMQRIAAEVGYSETAFLAPSGEDRWTMRYYSPKAEVSFCGHATIASGVALAERHGERVFRLETRVGEVPVAVRRREDGRWLATLTSVDPDWRPVAAEILERTLELLGWSRGELDSSLEPGVAYAGAWHLVIAVAARSVLARLDYDFDQLLALAREHDLTTLQLIWREDEATFHARDPFPIGGVVEDPATGAAAAALGGYLRARGWIEPPGEITIHQGHDMGRPSTLFVSIPVDGGIEVSGTAVSIAP